MTFSIEKRLSRCHNNAMCVFQSCIRIISFEKRKREGQKMLRSLFVVAIMRDWSFLRFHAPSDALFEVSKMFKKTRFLHKKVFSNGHRKFSKSHNHIMWVFKTSLMIRRLTIEKNWGHTLHSSKQF